MAKDENMKENYKRRLRLLAIISFAIEKVVLAEANKPPEAVSFVDLVQQYTLFMREEEISEMINTPLSALFPLEFSGEEP